MSSTDSPRSDGPRLDAALEVTGHHPAREEHGDADALVGRAPRAAISAKPSTANLLVWYAPSRTDGASTLDDAVNTMRRNPLPRAQHRQELAHRADGAEHVDVEHPLPVLLGELVDRAELLHADVRAEHVAAAERGPRRARPR